MAAVQPFDIIKSAFHQFADFPDVTISPFSQSCYNYQLQGENECTPTNEEAPVFNFEDIFVEINEWNPPEAENQIIFEENEAGDRRVKLFRQKRYISFDALVDPFHLNLLHNFQLYQTWKIIRRDNGQDFDLGSFEVGNARPEGGGYYTVTVKMHIKDGDSVIDSCCGSAFEGAPYEDCTDATGEPTVPPECAAYMMNPLVFDATAMTLTATTTGQPPSTTETFTWYYFRDALSPVIILTTTAAVITVTEPGTYRVIAKAGICETPPEEFVYADDCASFDAVISVDGPYIIIEPNRFSTLVWEVDTGGGFVPFPDTSHVIQPTVTGTYQVTVTSGTCEVIRSIPFVVTDCDFTIALALVNGIIESTIVGYTGVDTPTYQWYMDTGSGVVLILGAVDANYEPAEPGNYLVDVTLDACTKRANLVVLGECVAFNPYIEYVKDDGGGDVLIAAGHTGAPGPVTFEWWQIRNSVWTNIGVGGSITTDQEGPTKVIATSEGCVKERFTQACIDPANLEWEEREVAATDGQTVFAEPTYFGDIGIPTNTAGLSRERVDAEWELWKNGARLFFVHIADAVANDRTVWSINGAGAIELQWPASAGDSFVLVRRYIP